MQSPEPIHRITPPVVLPMRVCNTPARPWRRPGTVIVMPARPKRISRAVVLAKLRRGFHNLASSLRLLIGKKGCARRVSMKAAVGN